MHGLTTMYELSVETLTRNFSTKMATFRSQSCRVNGIGKSTYGC